MTRNRSHSLSASGEAGLAPSRQLPRARPTPLPLSFIDFVSTTDPLKAHRGLQTQPLLDHCGDGHEGGPAEAWALSWVCLAPCPAAGTTPGVTAQTGFCASCVVWGEPGNLSVLHFAHLQTGAGSVLGLEGGSHEWLARGNRRINVTVGGNRGSPSPRPPMAVSPAIGGSRAALPSAATLSPTGLLREDIIKVISPFDYFCNVAARNVLIAGLD